MGREKPLDLAIVQAWLAAWNERDVFSDAAVNHLRSLITEAHCLVVVILGLGREPRSRVFRRVKRVLRRAWCRRPGQLRACRCIGLRHQCVGRHRLVHWRDLDRRGLAATVGLLRRSLAPGGMILIGEVCWRREPPDQATVEGCGATSEDAVAAAAGVHRVVGELGCDVVAMVLAEDSWDRYEAAKWLNIRRWLDASKLADLRAELTAAPARHARYQREYLGWGAFALMNR